MIILSIIISIVVFIITESFSAFIASLIVAGIGNFFVLSIKKEYQKRAFILFNIIFVVYSFFAIAHYVDFAYYGNLKYIDEYRFVETAEQLGTQNTIKDIYKSNYDRNQVIDNRGYGVYIGSIVLLSKSLGTYNIYVLFLSSILFGALSSILIYRLLLFYLDQKTAFTYALFFMLFSPLLLYSFVVLRDIAITFFFLAGFVIIHKEFSIKNLVYLVFLDILIFNFRTEHGIVFILFIFFYLYKKFKKNKVIFVSLILTLVGASSVFIYNAINTLSRTIDIYSEFSQSEALSAGGDSLGAKLQQLPSPIREVAIFFNSLINPFPSWLSVEASTNIYQAITSISPIFYSFFWFTVTFGVIKWFLIKKKYKLLNSELKLLFYIAVLLYAGNLVSFNIRRIMFVYPIIYLVYAVINTKFLHRSDIRNTIMQSTTIYIGLIIVYMVAKSFIF
jgi:4-amino-4-deoxy-L-arabinose transferase-like glycosyltransferase